MSTLRAVICLLFSFPFLLMGGCGGRPADETARSGEMTLAVDRQLESIAGIQSDMFRRYYPDARITAIPSGSAKTLGMLLSHTARAALISGKPDAREDSLFAELKPPLRFEPVARDAIVCIVNSRNPAASLSLKELAALFYGNGNTLTPLVTGDDYRLHSLLAALTGERGKNLRAGACSTNTELIARVAADSMAAGLMFRSSFDSPSGRAQAAENVRIMPIREYAASKAYLPTPENIFDGRYPLVAIVYYVYYSGDALPAGFGSWLQREGQKAFERSSFAPFRMVERTIILK